MRFVKSRSKAVRGVAGMLALALSCMAARALASPETVAATLARPGAWAYVDASGKIRPSGSFTGVPPDSALTAEGLARRQAFDFKTDDPVLGCGEPGMPRALTAASPMTFAWNGTELQIKYESMDVTRSVHMDGRAAPRGTTRSANGYAVGRWEGDTLVIETSLLDPRTQDLQGTPKGEGFRLLERYRLDDVAGEPRLSLDLTMIDDAVFVEPYEWHFDFVLKPDWALLPYECEERPAALTPGVIP